MKPISKDLKQASVEIQAELAFSKIATSVAYAEQSSKKLAMKLKYAGFIDEAVDLAICKAKDFGLIDDKRYCNMLLRKNFKSLNKAYAILFEVKQLGFDPEKLETYERFEKRILELKQEKY